ncbi:DUF1836 domain-containing protein [Paenisporosarcina quisquiliarum]|uniref:DUF1836 domain-containing protein n=1 Tax=Paenisporosarcina quisquiliarum TaxID=365346 RepID=UPI003736AF70
MENINDLLEKISLEKSVSLEEMPEIDLYMDQVIQLFDQKYKETKRNEDEKILTKTMINNYAKGKLFIPIKNKKYSKKHLILISLIYQLKGALSITDIKSTLQIINDKITSDDINLDAFYTSLLTLQKTNAENVSESIPLRHQEVKRVIDAEDEKLEQIMLIASLVNISNSYRKIAERLIDDLTETVAVPGTDTNTKK